MISPGSLYQDVIYPGGIKTTERGDIDVWPVSEEGPRGVGKGWREVAWSRSASITPSYELGSDGLLASTATTSASVRFHEPGEPDAAGGSVTFTTAPLDADHVLIGHAALHVRVTLSASDANFYAELIDVDPKGDEALVNDGFLKASHRNSDTTPEPVTPGTAIDYVVPIRADHYRFVAGDSVRVRVSGGKSTSLVPVAQPVDVVIQTGSASTLHLSPGW